MVKRSNRKHRWILQVLLGVTLSVSVLGQKLPARTTLSDPQIAYKVPESGYVVIRRGGIEMIVVDNRAVNDTVLPEHRAGYSGIASLRHEKQPLNLFVPKYAGLNFEHIHDGTIQTKTVLYEPRNVPIELRVVNDHVVELYQRPTTHWKLESSTRYELLPDGSIEILFECIPREPTYKNDYIGLFWASYINSPESTDIHFRGKSDWIRAVTTEHGLAAVHRAVHDSRSFVHEPELGKALTLLFGFSDHRYAKPWYFGISRGMALVFVFREKDQIRFTHSPSGGGRGNPAWDFQWFIEHPEINKTYQMKLRVLYVPYESHQQLQKMASKHLRVLKG